MTGIDSKYEIPTSFDIEISDEYAEKMLTAGDVYTYLDNNVDDRYILDSNSDILSSSDKS